MEILVIGGAGFIGSHIVDAYVSVPSGRETSIKEMLSTIQTAIGTSLLPEYQPPKPGEQLRSCLDSTAARETLGWEPRISLQEGIAQLVEEIIPHS